MKRPYIYIALLCCITIGVFQLRGDGLWRRDTPHEVSFEELTKDFKAWDGELLFPSNALEPDDPLYWYNANRLYSYTLSGLEEVSLFKEEIYDDKKIIRLSIFSSVGSPMTVRIIAHEGMFHLIQKIGNQGYLSPVTEFKETTTILDANQFNMLLKQVEDASICSLDYDDTIGFDGSDWVLEIKNNDRYCVYKAWSPREGFLPDILESILQAQGLTPSEIESWLFFY